MTKKRMIFEIAIKLAALLAASGMLLAASGCGITVNQQDPGKNALQQGINLENKAEDAVDSMNSQVDSAEDLMDSIESK